MMEAKDRIVFFDGVCHLCHGTVNFLIRRDPGRQLSFCPLQSAGAAPYLENVAQAKKLDSILFLESGHWYIRSEAALRIARYLPFPWKLAYYLIVIPRFIRDAIYDLIARYRYRIFGRYDQCMVPDQSLRDRFIL